MTLGLGPNKTAGILKALGSAVVGVGVLTVGFPLWAGAAAGVGAWLYLTRDG
jgi:hypothetical protein